MGFSSDPPLPSSLPYPWTDGLQTGWLLLPFLYFTGLSISGSLKRMTAPRQGHLALSEHSFGGHDYVTSGKRPLQHCKMHRTAPQQRLIWSKTSVVQRWRNPGLNMYVWGRHVLHFLIREKSSLHLSEKISLLFSKSSNSYIKY